jgi:hypothetical protein
MFESVLRHLAEHLERRRIPYMVMGGQAVLAYGVFRSTKDIDVTLGIGPDGIDVVLNLVKDCGWKVIPEDPKTFVADTLCCRASTRFQKCESISYSHSRPTKPQLSRGREQ